MGKIALQRVFDNLSKEQFEKLKEIKEETINHKYFTRAQRRRLERNWRKYNLKREE